MDTPVEIQYGGHTIPGTLEGDTVHVWPNAEPAEASPTRFRVSLVVEVGEATTHREAVADALTELYQSGFQAAIALNLRTKEAKAFKQGPDREIVPTGMAV